MNYFCVVSYLGFGYNGWQRQPGHLTVQGKIEECLSIYFDDAIVISGGGRTDAGVNASGQVFTFYTERPITSKESFLHAMNYRLLPSDITILSIDEIPDDFHARHNSTMKTYQYTFRLGEKKPLESMTVAQMGTRPFDLENFLTALEMFLGTHNFQDFTNKAFDPEDYVRTIYRIEVNIDEKEDPKLISVTFYGNRFMTYQVRFMMGAAFRVGFSQMSLEEFKNHLDSKERQIINFKANPAGLNFVEVAYDPPKDEDKGFFVSYGK